MIRSNLPLPFLYRLRLRAGEAARRAAPRPAIRRPIGENELQAWMKFVDHYERFTEVLCAAAKNGCDARKENEYAQMRFWFMGNYYRTAARVRPALEAEFSAETGPSIADYAGQKRALDALEALFLPPTLREVLKHDTGNLIPRIARLSEVIYGCHAG